MDYETQHGVLFRDWTLVLKQAKQIRLLTDEEYSIGTSTVGRSSEMASIQFVIGVSGEGEMKIGHNLWLVRVHDLLQMDGEQTAVLVNKSSFPLICYVMECHRVDLLQVTQQNYNSGIREENRLFIDSERDLIRLCQEDIDDIRQIIEAFEQAEIHHVIVPHLLFQKWLCTMVEQRRREAVMQHPDQAVQRTIEYLNEHYDKPVTVQQLAQMANVSRKWYTVKFKEMTSQNPSEYITSLRMKRAKELLNLTKDSIHEIARKVGYDDEHYFSRRFKQKVGESPRMYIHNRRYYGTTMTAPELLLTLGMTPVAAQAPYCKFPKYLKESFKQVRKCEGTQALSMENIRKMKPDLILASAWQDSMHYEQLNRIATTVLLPERNNWRDELRDLGEILGKSRQAAQVISSYEKGIELAKEQLHTLIPHETIVYIRLTDEGITLYGEQSSRGSMLYGELDLNKPKALWLGTEGKLISVEQLAEMQPEHILLHTEEREDAVLHLFHHPMWNELYAVQHQQVHVLSSTEWYNFSFSPLATQYAIEEMISLIKRNGREL